MFVATYVTTKIVVSGVVVVVAVVDVVYVADFDVTSCGCGDYDVARGGSSGVGVGAIVDVDFISVEVLVDFAIKICIVLVWEVVVLLVFYDLDIVTISCYIVDFSLVGRCQRSCVFLEHTKSSISSIGRKASSVCVRKEEGERERKKERKRAMLKKRKRVREREKK